VYALHKHRTLSDVRRRDILGNVRRVVYGLSEESLYEIVGDESEEALYLPCREIFGRGKKPIEVIGPSLEAEAREVHLGFWR